MMKSGTPIPGSRFRLGAVPKSPDALLARELAYGALLGRRGLNRRMTVKQCQQIENSTRERWQAIINKLGKRCWDLFAHPNDPTRACNCPPVGVRTEQDQVCCNTPLICPYCHARRVLDLYRRLSLVIWGTVNSKSGLEAKPVSIWSFSSHFDSFDVCQFLGEGLPLELPTNVFEQALDAYSDWMPEQRRQEFGPETLGGFCLHTVDFAFVRISRGRRVLPTLRRSGIVIGHKEQQLKFNTGIKVKTLTSPLTREALATMLCDVCAFPTGWFSAGPHFTAQYLEWAHRKRFLSTFGVLRSRNQIPDTQDREDAL